MRTEMSSSKSSNSSGINGSIVDTLGSSHPHRFRSQNPSESKTLRRTAFGGVLLIVLAAVFVLTRILGNNNSAPIAAGVPNGGRAIQITVAGGCPSPVAPIGVKNSGGGRDSHLVPSEAPSAGLVCSYTSSTNGTNDETQANLHTSGSIPLSKSAARTLSVAIQKIRLVSHANGKCPNETGSTSVIIFSYPDRSDFELRYLTSGCQTLDNGTISAGQYNNSSFYGRFASVYAQLGA